MTVTPLPASRGGSRRRSTSTATFGSGRREGHDASAFYGRFVAPEITSDSQINRTSHLDAVHVCDARNMDAVADNSVALVVTSPPYFAGKQYEQDLGVGGVPADYFEYLDLLRDVFTECRRVLEPGGRIAVNIANLGRRPYRSLSGDVTTILSDLGLLMRGEVVWVKGRAAGGSCAWGSFQSPSNPVLRDVTERIVIASKGRFDRALTTAQRSQRGLPAIVTISRDEFMEATTDLWEMAPERASRVGHPAPFPVELPQRLIDLYTYEGDVVLDPFMGSGSTAVAAIRTGRRYIGFDTDESYVAIAESRVAQERSAIEDCAAGRSEKSRLEVRVGVEPDLGVDESDSAGAEELALRSGLKASDFAELLLASSGFTDIRADVKPRGLGMTLDFVATDSIGRTWAFDVSGAFTSNRSGLRNSDNLFKSLGRASVIHESAHDFHYVLLTTDLPTKGSAGERALRTVVGADRPVTDVIGVLDEEDRERLASYSLGAG